MVGMARFTIYYYGPIYDGDSNGWNQIETDSYSKVENFIENYRGKYSFHIVESVNHAHQVILINYLENE